MPLSINTNVASLTAQRAMLNSNSALETAFERLSTGKRINSASDDAAGLAIGKGLESRVSGLNQAIRNVNDGISMVQIAEGAMDEVTSILQRMRDLSVQAANGSLSSVEQGYLDAEQAKLAETLGTVLDVARFNQIDLVSDIANTSITIQSGSDTTDTTSISFSKMTEISLGVDAAAIDLQGNTSKVKSVAFDGFIGNSGGAVAQLEVASIGVATGGTGQYVVQLDGNTFQTGSIAAPADVDALVTELNNISGVSDLGVFSNNSGALTFVADAAGEYVLANTTIKSEGFTSDLASTAFTAVSGATKGSNFTASGSDVYTMVVGSRTFVTDAATGGTTNKAVAALMQAELINEGVTDISVGTAGGYDNGAITLTYTSATGNENELTYTFNKTAGGAQVSGDSSGDTTTINVSSANDAIAKIDAALAAVANERATLGATQAQLESTVRNLANVAENTSAAAGRIMDTDYAAETANLTKAQILQQAATSILAQANAQPQGVLALLR